MEIIDVHAHLYHPDWYPLSFQRRLAISYLSRRGQEISEAAVSRELQTLNRLLSDRDGSVCLGVMDKAGIAKRVLHVLDWGLELGEPACSAAAINEAVLAICRRHSDRLIGFASVDPRRPEAVSLIVRTFDTQGASGLKLHPTSRGWTLDDERVSALIDLAAQRKFPVMLHTGATVSELTDENCQPAALLRLAAKFRAVNFIAGHSAFSNWRAFGPSPPPNVWFDISAWQDRMSSSAEAAIADLQQLLASYPGKVLYGTDAPFYGFNMAHSESKWITRVRECAEQAGPRAASTVFAGAVLSCG